MLLCSLVEPDRAEQTQSVWRQAEAQSANPYGKLRHRIAVDKESQQLIGYAAFWNGQQRKFRMSLMVHPDRRQEGIGAALFNVLLAELAPLQAASLQARVWQDQADSLRFLQKRGFVEIHRMYELRLAVQQADWSPFIELPERLAARGIEITTLQQEAETDPACWRKLTDLQNSAMPDWPDPDPNGITTRYSVDEFRRMFSSWQMMPDAFFIAKAEGRYVGYTGLGTDAQTTEGIGEAVGSGPTAVRPGYRNRGLATVLKLLSLNRARQLGYVLAYSRSANPAMIRVNEKLGFVRGRAEVRLVKRLEADRSWLIHR